jgi:broad specificity phosphatase PhoE
VRSAAHPVAALIDCASLARVGRFLDDLRLRWAGQRVLVIGHVATRWGLDHLIGGVPLEDLVTADFAWQPG